MHRGEELNWSSIAGVRHLPRRPIVRCEELGHAVPRAPQKSPESAPVSDIFAARLNQAKAAQLEQRVEALEARSAPYVTFLASFAPEPYTIKAPIPILIRPEGDEFGASFFDANIHAAGETEQEAFENLRSLILDFYEQLRDAPPSSLGPEMVRCVAILREFVDG